MYHSFKFLINHEFLFYNSSTQFKKYRSHRAATKI